MLYILINSVIHKEIKTQMVLPIDLESGNLTGSKTTVAIIRAKSDNSHFVYTSREKQYMLPLQN